MKDELNRRDAETQSAPESTAPKISHFTGKGLFVLNYPEGRISMSKGTAAGKPCIYVKLEHKESGNVHKLGFTENGLSAFVILAEHIMNLPKAAEQTVEQTINPT